MKFRFIPFAVLIFATGFYCCQNVDNNSNILPAPTNGTIVLENVEEGENQGKREAWIESMHKTAPGTNWRSIENQTAFVKYQDRLRQRKEATNRSGDCEYEYFSNNTIRGQWRERGSANQAGNVLVTAIEGATETIFTVSAGGTLWKGNIIDGNWEVMNQDLRFGTGFLEIIPTPNGRRLIAILGGIPQYSDDDGLTWTAGGGINANENNNTKDGEVILVNGSPVIYLISKENNWADLKLYESSDLGENYSVVQTFDNTSNWNRIALDKIKGSEQLVIFHTRSNQTSIYQLSDVDAINLKNIISSFNFSGRRTNVTAVYTNDSSRIYTYDSNLRVRVSDDFGTTWEERGTLPNNPWNVGMYVSQKNPDLLLYGEVECFRSDDGGMQFNKVNSWGAYYGNPAKKLHADIMYFDEVLDVNGLDIITISNHGGLSISTDGLLTTSNIGLSKLNVSQYYDVATDPIDHNTIYAGTQDQGFQRATPNNDNKVLGFDQVVSGDYGHICFSENGKRMWMVYPGGAISYYPNPKGSSQAGWTLDSQDETVWIPPLVSGPYPEKNEVYLAGGNSLGGFGSYIIRLTASESGGSHSVSSEVIPWNFLVGGSGTISYIAFSPINPDHWYVSTTNGYFFYSTDGGQTFERNDNSLAGPHYNYGAAIHPSEADENTVYFGGSGYNNPPVYVSTDNGKTFSPMNEGLPSTLVFELDGNEDDSQIYAATEAGPYVYNQEDQRWYDLSTPCTPNQTWWSVEYLEETETVRFGTFGRGIWDLSIGINVDTKNPQLVSEELKIYPNPSIGPLTVDLPENLGSNVLKITSINGQTLKTVNITPGNNKLSLDLNDFTAGIYEISILNSTHHYTQRLILQ